jgi:SAM-dependent methyltransferase
METIIKVANGVHPAFAMLAGCQLDVFTPLKDGALSAEQIAAALGAGVTKLRPLLYALVSAGLLTVADDRFANTAETNYFFVKGTPAYMGSVHELWSLMWNAELKTADSVRSGAPQAKHDYATMPSDELERTFRGLHAGTMGAGRMLAKRYDFSSCQTLVDVGGGSGGLGIALAQAFPHLRVTVVDLPSVTPITQRFVDEARIGERLQVVATDVVRGSLSGTYDVAVLRAVIQTLSAEEARLALKNVGRALNDGGVIYIIGAVLDDSRLAPPETVAFNLVFLNVYDGGQAYTEQEHRDWLAEASFEAFARVILPDGNSVITARKRA